MHKHVFRCLEGVFCCLDCNIRRVLGNCIYIYIILSFPFSKKKKIKSVLAIIFCVFSLPKWRVTYCILFLFNATVFIYYSTNV
jgi:hypothetical protein